MAQKYSHETMLHPYKDKKGRLVHGVGGSFKLAFEPFLPKSPGLLLSSPHSSNLLLPANIYVPDITIYLIFRPNSFIFAIVGFHYTCTGRCHLGGKIIGLAIKPLSLFRDERLLPKTIPKAIASHTRQEQMAFPTIAFHKAMCP